MVRNKPEVKKTLASPEDIKIDFIIPSVGDRPEHLKRAIFSIHEAMRGTGFFYQIIPVIKKQSPAHNRQEGLNRSSGEYVIYCDDDDAFVKNFMVPEVKNAFLEGVDFILWDAYHVEMSTKYIPGVENPIPGWPAMRWENNPRALWTALTKGTNQFTIGSYAFSKKLKCCKWKDCRFEDYEMALQLIKTVIDNKLSFRTINKCLYMYSLNMFGRNRSDSVSQDLPFGI